MLAEHKSLWGISKESGMLAPASVSFSKMPLVIFWFFLWSWFWKKIIKWIVDFYVVWCTWVWALLESNPSWLCLHGPFSGNAPSPTHNSWKMRPLHCLKWLPSLLKKIHDTGEYHKRKNLNKKFEQVFMLSKSSNNRFYQIGAGVSSTHMGRYFGKTQCLRLYPTSTQRNFPVYLEGTLYTINISLEKRSDITPTP